VLHPVPHGILQYVGTLHVTLLWMYELYDPAGRLVAAYSDSTGLITDRQQLLSMDPSASSAGAGAGVDGSSGSRASTPLPAAAGSSSRSPSRNGNLSAAAVPDGAVNGKGAHGHSDTSPFRAGSIKPGTGGSNITPERAGRAHSAGMRSPTQPLSRPSAGHSKHGPAGGPIKVLYRFHYANNQLHQLEARCDYSCPWCPLMAGDVEGLLCHLAASHDHFIFLFKVGYSVVLGMWSTDSSITHIHHCVKWPYS